MRYERFSVQQYRAISSAELSVGQTLIPLIGVNESGKTSILQALLAFDRISDRVNGWSHLDYRNKYSLGDHPASVAADIRLDGESDLEAISSRLSLTRGNPLMRQLEMLCVNRETIRVVRDLSTRKYRVEGLDMPEGMRSRLAKALYRQLPLILYFDDFTDRVPESVRFVFAENERGYSIRKTRDSVWQLIIEEIFRRASADQGFSLSDFIRVSNQDERDSRLSDIKDELQQEIIADWQRLRSSSPHLADDVGDLSVDLRYQALDEGFKFEFKVADRSNRRGRYFNVVDRSKGFQWYFNFLMKLKFNPKYQAEQTGAIYLLDEPGSYLHSSAQEELLRALKRISETNTIIYCTHSQHLLDPDIINVGQTRIVGKEQGVVTVRPFGSSAGAKQQGALTPLYNALHLRTGAFNREMRRVVICEGITDYYFFRLLSTFDAEFHLDGIEFIPGAGAGQLKELISLAIAWSDRYLVLLDSDAAGEHAYRRYSSFFGESEAAHFVRYAIPTRSRDVTLEDFLSDDDREKALVLTGASSLKSAFVQLYHADRSSQQSIFGELDAGSRANLRCIWNRITALAV